MPEFSFEFKPRVLVGQQSISRLAAACRSYCERVLLIADPSLHNGGSIDRTRRVLEEAGISVIVFDGIPPQATALVASEAAELGSGARCQALIGFGGAKTLEIAKLTAILIGENCRLYEILDGANSQNSLPYIDIPTSGRDPFLFTNYFVAIDPRDRQVKAINIPPNFCVLAAFDSDPIKSLSNTLRATAAFDGLCASIEAYCSSNANFFSDAVLEKAITLYGLILEPLGKRLEEADEIMVQAGFLSALGCAASSPGLASALAYAINARFPVAKSWVSTVLLPYEMERLLAARADRLAKIAVFLGEAGNELSVPAAGALAVESVRKLLGRYKLPGRLKDLGLVLDRLLPVVENALGLGFVANRAIPASTENTFDLLKQAF